MKIGLDVSQVIFGGGVAVYTENLVNALLKYDQKNEYRLFFSSLRRQLPPQLFPSPGPRLKLIKSRFPPSLLDIFWNQLHVFPIDRFLGKVDVFHSSDWTQPPTKAKKVTTIHDLSFLRWPKTTHPKILAVQKRRLAWVKKEVDHIIAVSEVTKKEIVDLLQINPKKITVIPEALPEGTKQWPAQNGKSVLKKLNIDRPYVVAYGSASPRKNIEKLIKAFRQINRQHFWQLVITGNYPLPGKAEDIVTTGFLDRHDWLSVFGRAEVFAFPSLYEGFGLPILEAFSLKVPVLTSRVSSMPEVAGKAALFVDPSSVDSIAAGLKKLLTDSNLSHQLVVRGQERLKLFSWKKVASATLKIYETV